MGQKWLPDMKVIILWMIACWYILERFVDEGLGIDTPHPLSEILRAKVDDPMTMKWSRIDG